MAHKAILLISCLDQKGITAAVTNFVYENAGNIEHADQHIDEQTNTFFMRIEWSLDSFKVPQDQISSAFQPLAEKFHMQWSLHFNDYTPQVAIFVSKPLHCLYDLLLKYKEGQFPCHIPLIVSNHPDARPVAENFGIKFFEFDITGANKLEQEASELALMRQARIDTIVLARYMHILSEPFVKEYHERIINIHHSFLPAFIGKNPYGQAYRQGVKIIGATSHYVTSDLDRGPIIEQDTVRVNHRDSLEDLRRKGQDLEKMVLGRAVRWHLERKILVYNNKTVVFD